MQWVVRAKINLRLTMVVANSLVTTYIRCWSGSSLFMNILQSNFSNFSLISKFQWFQLEFYCSNSMYITIIWETSRNKLKKHSVSKIVLTFHNLNKLFYWSQKIYKFSDISFVFQKIFLITRSMISHSRSEQFWKQNTIFKS